MNAAAEQNREGIYPLAIAARIAQLAPQTARRWVKGYHYPHQGERRFSAPVTYLAQPGTAATRDLTFEELLTLRLVMAFKKKGLSLPTIKKAAEKAAAKYGADNPFITQRFRSNGQSVFLDLDVADAERRQLVNVLTDQHQFREIVEPLLFRDVVFVGDRPREWRPLGQEHSVIITPARQFGAPHIAGKGVRTDVVADAVRAEGADDKAISAVAEWFGLTEAEVRDAVQFEDKWLTRKAA